MELDPGLVAAITVGATGIGGFWAVWTRAADARAALRKELLESLAKEEFKRESGDEKLAKADGRLAEKIAAGDKADSDRDGALAVLVETVARIEQAITAELRRANDRLDRTNERLDQLANKVESHMDGEVAEVRCAFRDELRAELRAVVERLQPRARKLAEE